jgi:hypothetical protein
LKGISRPGVAREIVDRLTMLRLEVEGGDARRRPVAVRVAVVTGARC